MEKISFYKLVEKSVKKSVETMSTNVEIVTESSTSLCTSSKDNKYRQLTEYTGRKTGNQELNFTNRAVILSTNDTDSPKLEVRLNLEKSGSMLKNSIGKISKTTNFCNWNFSSGRKIFADLLTDEIGKKLINNPKFLCIN